MGKNWNDVDDGELTERYQDALEDSNKDQEDRNYSDDDIKDIQKEIQERDNL